MSTTGRNEPCPCGSGKKFKVCHGNVGRGKEPTGELLQQFLATADALEFQRQKQQGLGRPIISANVNGLRAVAVGDALVFTGAKTFHEFLWDYIKGVFGSEWGNCELKKPAAERHPMLNWYQEAGAYIAAARQQQPEPKGKVSRIESVGIVSGYLQLAYGLYLIAHNKELEQRLIKRLKHPDQFLPAYYEVLVFGTLVRAGFALEFENESDHSKTHCEVTATFLKTGKKFSVEAKMRQTATASVDIGRQLKKALLKSAASMRIVFAEVNLPELPPSNDRLESRILADIHKRERETLDDGSPLPSAYVVVTNHPFFYFPKQSVKPWALAEGFRLLDFGSRAKFATLREALDARRKHWEMFALMKSWEENYAIPMTFDGDIPELAFGEGHPPRLVIGHRYNIPDTNR